MNNDKKGAATKPQLNALHEEFAKKLRTHLEEGETVVVSGKTHQVSCSAAMLNVIRGFLKDNNIACDPNLVTGPVTSLAESLEAFNNATNDEDEAPHFDS